MMCVSELQVLIRHMLRAVWLTHRLRDGLPFMRSLSAPSVGEVRTEPLTKWMGEDRENYEWAADLFRSACQWLRKRDKDAADKLLPKTSSKVVGLDAWIAYSCHPPANIDTRRKNAGNCDKLAVLQFKGFPHNPNLAYLDWCKKRGF